jgi:hypothetical protein
LLKGGLHIHTTCSDGQLTPVETAAIYKELGFDFIAFTDHDHLHRGNDCYREAIGKNGLIIFEGIELTVFEKGYVHINRIKGDNEVLHIFNHPGEYGLPLEKIIERIESVSKKLPLDAVEVSSKGFYTPQFDVPEIKYPKVVADDSHTSFGCGRAWIEVEAKKNKDSIIKAIKAGRLAIKFK